MDSTGLGGHMDTNDFIGSFAQENVSFSTQIIKTARVGDNFYKVMIFVEDTRFVNAVPEKGWLNVPGSQRCKALTVSADTYAETASGLLQSWLYDLFGSGYTGDCILVSCGDVNITYEYTPVTPVDGSDISGLDYYHSTDGGTSWEKASESTADTTTYTYATRSEGTVDTTSFIEGMEEAYSIMKPYAYHKTVCAGSENAVNPAIAVSLAKLCMSDKGLLSGAVLLPFTTTTPENPESDPLYAALSAESCDAFMSAHQDPSRNGSLVSLGIALALINGSGTPVGNNMEMTATGMISSSGPEGLPLARSIRDLLAGKNIQTWKAVGDNTGNVAAFGANTLLGDVYSAIWILSYCTYMIKVRVAQLLTSGNFLKNADNYGRIVTTMNAVVGIFVNAGRIENYVCTAPSFESLPEASSDEIVVPNAWSATYVSNTRKVTITGTLYIGA